MDIKTIISLIILISGIGIILNLIYIYYYYFYSVTLKKWCKIEGEIVESKIEYFRSITDADTEGWRQKVVYTFNIDGTNYINDKTTKNIRILLPSESLAKNMSNNYLVGQNITMCFNKNNPKKSIIDSSFNYKSLFLILISILSFFIADYIENNL